MVLKAVPIYASGQSDDLWLAPQSWTGWQVCFRTRGAVLPVDPMLQEQPVRADIQRLRSIILTGQQSDLWDKAEIQFLPTLTPLR